MKTKRIAVAAVAMSLVVAACGSDDSSSGTDGTTGGSAPESILNGEIKCEQQFKGKSVSVFSPVRDSDNDKPIADYVAAYQPLVDCTGVEIKWEGTDQFETEINVRLEGGNAPDVIDFPQPGLLAATAVHQVAGSLRVEQPIGLPSPLDQHVGFERTERSCHRLPCRPCAAVGIDHFVEATGCRRIAEHVGGHASIMPISRPSARTCRAPRRRGRTA